MNARRLGLFLIITVVLGSAVFSSFPADVFGSTKTSAFLSNVEKSNNRGNLKEAIVSQHKITAAELQAIENRVGVSIEGQDYNQLIDGHGTGLRAPTASEWQQIAQTAQTVENVTYLGSPPHNR